VAEIMEAEINHFRLTVQSSPERAEGGRIPSPEDSTVHMDEIASEGFVGGRIEGNFSGCLFKATASRRQDQPPAIIALAQPGPVNLQNLRFAESGIQSDGDNARRSPPSLALVPFGSCTITPRVPFSRPSPPLLTASASMLAVTNNDVELV
jgi:hypothetical protein